MFDVSRQLQTIKLTHMKSLNLKILISFAVLTFISVLVSGQDKKIQEFDIPVFHSIDASPNLIYLKWFSTGKKPSPDFMVLRYEGKQAVAAEGVKAIFSKADTTFYTFFDTTTLKKTAESEIQYFIVQLNRDGKTGKSSKITLVSTQTEKIWFTETKAEKHDKMLAINISWKITNQQRVQFFEIERSTHPDQNFTALVSLPGDKNSYTDPEVNPDVVYYYRIRALSANNILIDASNVIFSAAYNPQPPAAPVLLNYKRLKGGVMLRYRVSDAEVTGVRIYRNDGITPDLKVVSDLLKPNDSLIISYYDTARTLSGNITYMFAARTESSSFVESSFSEITYIRPLSITPPEAPLHFAAYEEDKKIILNWENLEKRNNLIAGYLIERQEEGTGYQSLIPSGAILRNNYFADSTVKPGKLYSYRLFSVDIDGTKSNEASVFTIAGSENKPLPPFALQAYVTETSVELEWAEVKYDGMSQFHIYRYERGKSPVKIGSTAPGENRFTDSSAKTGITCFYYITTSNATGTESAASEEIAVKR